MWTPAIKSSPRPWTLSGSKVELTHDLGAEIDKIVAAASCPWSTTPTPTTCGVCHLDVGEPFPIQIVTGAWNIHVGDLVPVALDGASLPGGKKIEKGLLRGIESNGMMCGLYELGLDERDFPYAAITPAALLNDYHPLDPAKPSIPADIQPGGQGVRARGGRPGGGGEGEGREPLDLQSVLRGEGRPQRCHRHHLLPQPPHRRPGGLQHQDQHHLHPGRPAGPSRRSSPTASPTASSSSTRRGWGPATTSSR